MSSITQSFHFQAKLKTRETVLFCITVISFHHSSYKYNKYKILSLILRNIYKTHKLLCKFNAPHLWRNTKTERVNIND